MKGQTGVLQQGVQVIAIQRRVGQTQERVRGEEHKGQERHTDHALHGQNPRLQRGRKVVAKPHRTSSKQRQGQRPQEQTALMVAPHAGNLVQHRLVGVRIQRDKPQGKVRHHKGIGQRGKGCGDQDQLHKRCRFRQGHQPTVAPRGAVQGQCGLHERNRKGKDQRKMAQFDDHRHSPISTVA